jgi:hypothetical protein
MYFMNSASAGMFNHEIRKSIDRRAEVSSLFFSFLKSQSMSIMKRRTFLQASVASAHCHVEEDQSPGPIASVKQSLQYLKSL